MLWLDYISALSKVEPIIVIVPNTSQVSFVGIYCPPASFQHKLMLLHLRIPGGLLRRAGKHVYP